VEDSVNQHVGMTVGDLHHLYATGDLVVTMGGKVEQALLLNLSMPRPSEAPKTSNSTQLAIVKPKQVQLKSHR